MNPISLPLLAASLFSLSSPAFAQAPLAPQHAPDGSTRETFASITIPPMLKAPFAATVNTEWIRHLPDGNNITLINHRAVARDSQGRIFEERAWFVPNDGKHESAAYQIEISDPVAHERYVCRIAEHICRLEQFFASNFAVSRTTAASPGLPGAPAIENLGTQNVSGLETIGTRETTLVETQTIGNEAPILERKEFWYSPQLGVNLITKREDARFATQQNFEVTNVALGEPDAQLFEVPAGYKVIDLRKPQEISPKQDTSQN
jgi:hypothetical protein